MVGAHRSARQLQHRQPCVERLAPKEATLVSSRVRVESIVEVEGQMRRRARRQSGESWQTTEHSRQSRTLPAGDLMLRTQESHTVPRRRREDTEWKV